jgi:hypothetical protein
MPVVKRMERGTTALWDDFINTLPLIKDELSFKETDQTKTEAFEKEIGLDYTLECYGESGKTIFSVSTQSDSSDLNEWNSIQYSLTIRTNDENENFFKTDRFRAGKDQALAMHGWLIQALYERNLRVKPDLDKLLGGLDIRIISMPESDHNYDFLTLLRGLATEQYHIDVLRIRHVHMDEFSQSPEIKVEFSYAIQMSDFWAIFPILGAVWSNSYALDLKGGENELVKVNPSIQLGLFGFDFDKEEFMNFVMRYENTYRSHLDYSTLEDSINMLIDVFPMRGRELKTYYEKEINGIEDLIWKKDYPHAIRDLRALIEDESRALLRSHAIPYEEKDDLSDLKTKMIDSKLLEGRLRSWFEAFSSFGNNSAHGNYPATKSVRESSVVRNRTDLTILIGKELLSEIIMAIEKSGKGSTGS